MADRKHRWHDVSDRIPGERRQEANAARAVKSFWRGQGV